VKAALFLLTGGLNSRDPGGYVRSLGGLGVSNAGAKPTRRAPAQWWSGSPTPRRRLCDSKTHGSQAKREHWLTGGVGDVPSDVPA
jgi:hypothetical protein